MPQLEDFDQDIYFDIVASNLKKNLGDQALFYADEALKKMRAIGDSEGFDLWLGVHRHLSEKVADDWQEASHAVH